MKRASINSRQQYNSVDEEAKARLKHQNLLQEFLELQKEFVGKKRKLQAVKQKRETLLAEVQFLRQRYSYLSMIKSQEYEVEQDLVQSQNPYMQSQMLAKDHGIDVAVEEKPCSPPKPYAVYKEGVERSQVDVQASTRKAKKPKNNLMNGKRVGKKKISWQDQHKQNSKTISLHLNPKTTTLLSLQQSIQLQTQIPVSHQNFLFSPNPQNPDSVLLSQLNITPYSTLFLHVPLRGGTQPKGYDENQKFDEFVGNEISDTSNKARLLLKTQTNPGKIQAARQLIQKGCEECPKNEDVWLEACRLASPDEAKAVIARGLKSIPNSVKLWLQAAKLEHDDENKSRVLRRGLEHIPDSIRLWKAVIELLANEENAVALLERVVECCPSHVELWLALARLKDYEKAKKVLNRAREKLPKEPAIWITAAKLEEANGKNNAMVGNIIDRCIRVLQRQGLEIDREAWMKEAEAAERAGFVVTCQAII
ncbi:Ubiquitin [Corchorus olitorius]|uniref:Ubiquitin n=1 Tax=Corchorus olitorius TaxID=93759 RepID=A0A1R3J7E0_9ROSI|nr:Ubiquitin [Corchorus olitorius]